MGLGEIFEITTQSEGTENVFTASVCVKKFLFL